MLETARIRRDTQVVCRVNDLILAFHLHMSLASDHHTCLSLNTAGTTSSTELKPAREAVIGSRLLSVDFANTADDYSRFESCTLAINSYEPEQFKSHTTTSYQVHSDPYNPRALSKKPGKGGSGSKGGRCTFCLPSPIAQLKFILQDLRTQSWTDRLHGLQKDNYQTALTAVKQIEEFNQSTAKKFEDTVARYLGFQRSCSSTRTTLERVLSPTRTYSVSAARTSVREQVQQCSATLQSILKATVLPASPSPAATEVSDALPDPKPLVPGVIDLKDDSTQKQLDVCKIACETYLKIKVPGNCDLDRVASAITELTIHLPTLKAIHLDDETSELQQQALPLFLACSLLKLNLQYQLKSRVSVHGRRI